LIIALQVRIRSYKIAVIVLQLDVLRIEGIVGRLEVVVSRRKSRIPGREVLIGRLQAQILIKGCHEKY